ncbi:MAG TPA: TlyA family RNA methyltransferase [Candidatus Saccharimonadales bacterium]|nr:TlyA family RNA methyltransferase [Candidatus Saccharimonadales bacterium]
MKQRLDHLVFALGLVQSRSQAESWIKLGKVLVDGKPVTKSGTAVSDTAAIILNASEQYVSRAGLKLASVAEVLHLQFKGVTMLDVGSSTGGFTDYALQHGAQKIYAIELGTNQLHPKLHGDPRIELHEQTDILSVYLQTNPNALKNSVTIAVPDIIVIDVSFISLREILPHIVDLCGPQTLVAAMIKPQFEARESNLKHKGVIKNDRIRRDILKDFETWVAPYFVILDKADSDVAGTKGNRERFYKLRAAVQM